MDRDCDAEWMDRCARGDPAALSALHDRHAPALLKYLERLLGDAERAEDVCQESFVRIWRKAALFDPQRGSFRAWLYRAATNLAFNQLAPRSVRIRSLPEDMPVRDERASEPAKDASTVENARLLRAAFDRLGPPDRAILLLRHLEERPVVEVALLLGIPEGTVKSRCFYALRKLRLLLEELAPDLARELAGRVEPAPDPGCRNPDRERPPADADP